MKLFAAILFGAAVVTAIAASLPTGVRTERVYPFHYDNVMGTSLELKVRAVNEAAAGQAEAAVLDEIARESKILSAWDSTSDFSRWVKTAGTPVTVAPELSEVLRLFDTWRGRTLNAVDASAETIVQVWKQSAVQNRLPTGTELNRAVALVRQQHWTVSGNTATHLSQAPIALNSFAKLYVVDRAADAAMATGVSGVVVNAGGDIVVRGAVDETVNIADPFSYADNGRPIARLVVNNLAVATSGNYRRGFDIAGKHYSHIVDPRTGNTAEGIVSATVVAPKATDAGALATAFTVLKPEESVLLASTMPGVEFLLIDRLGKKMRSAGWNKLLLPMVAVSAENAAVDDSSMELVIDLDIKQPGGFAKRPYVAVWLEDKDKFPVRTVALWYDRDRWLPELRAWYRDDRLRATAEGTQITGTVASATRGAGKYTVKWDGKDNAGKPVKPGKYTIIVEASREHGPYQVMRGELDSTAGAKQITLTGNTDIATASVEYRQTEKH